MAVIALPPAGLVYLDANCLIYSVEAIEPYASLLTAIWEASESGQITIATSEFSLMEVLVLPLRQSNRGLAEAYRQLLLEADDVRLIEVDRAVLEQAAEIRAKMMVRPPDAIHAASAMRSGARLLVTNDRRLRTAGEVQVCVLGDLIAA